MHKLHPDLLPILCIIPAKHTIYFVPYPSFMASISCARLAAATTLQKLHAH